MNPLICDGDILVADYSQIDHNKLNGKIVIAWHEAKGLTVSRLRRYGQTKVLESENREYESVVLNDEWQILAEVLWWVGRDN